MRAAGSSRPSTFKALGYDSVVAGQKSYNGVAVLSRLPMDGAHAALPGLPAGRRAGALP